MMLLGLALSVMQVTLLREALALSSGNELALALGLSVWLLGGALGAALGGWIPVRWAPAGLATAGGLALVAPAGALLLSRLTVPIFHLPPGELLSLGGQLADDLLVLGPVSLLSGAIFTLACRQPDVPAAKVYLAEAVGWLLGGIAGAWVLVTLPAVTIVVLLWPVTLLALGCLLPRRRKALLLLILPALASLPWSGRWDTATLAWRWPEQRVAGVVYAPHGQGVVLERQGQRAIYLNGRLALVPGEMQPAEELASLALLQSTRPRLSRVLLVGGLSGLLPVVLKFPVDAVTVVELDPALTRQVLSVADPATLAALRDPRVRLIYGDARRLAPSLGPWDAVLLNLPEPSTLDGNRYYTRECFTALRGALQPDGILAFSLPGAENYYGEALLGRNGSVYQALTDVFPHVAVSPLGTNYFLASPARVTLDWEELGRRLTARHPALSYLNPYVFPALLPPDGLADLPRQFHEFGVPANRDLQPIAFRYDLALTQRQEGGGTDRLVDALTAWPPARAALGLLLIIACGAGLAAVPWRRGCLRRALLYFPVTAMGFAGMALNVLLLLLAQVALGALYHLLGALMAVWMAGLALGARLTDRWAPRWVFAPLLVVILLLLGLPAFAASTPVLPGAVTLAALLILALLGGLAVGMIFPLMTRRLPEPGGLYAADLLGAAPAGAVCAVILLPAHGFPLTCLLLAIPLAVSLVLWAVSSRFGKAGVGEW